MKEKAKINKLYVGTIDTVVTPKISMDDFRPDDVKENKLALLLSKKGRSYYIDVETGIMISPKLEDNLEKDEYFVNNSKPFMSFLDFLKLHNIEISDFEIEKDAALKLFSNLMNKDVKISEKTLTIIKPDAMKNIDKIIEIFYKNGLKISEYKITELDDELINDHYSHLIDKPFFPKLKQFMMMSPVAIMVLEGENAVKKLRELMGPTDSTKAGKDTIRGMFGTDATYNAIHGSDSIENAEIEINRFFRQKQKRI